MATSIVASALRANGYYLDAFNNILYMTAPFEKKSNIYGTPEYKLVCNIMAQYPDVQISIQKKSRKQTLRYDMMREFINIMPDSEKMLKEFERIQLMSHAYSSAYKYVENWFFKTYPHYGEFMVKGENGEVKWDVVALYKQAAEQKQEAEKKAAEEASAVPEKKPNLTLLAIA